MAKTRRRGTIVERNGIFSIKYSAQGKQIWEGAGPSRRAAERLLTRRLAELDQGRLPARTSIFEAHVLMWRSDCFPATQLKPSTLAAYDSILARHLLPFFGAMPVAAINALTVQRFVSGLVSSPAGLSPKTVSNCVRLLSRLMELAVTWNLASSNPCRKLTLPEPRRKEMDFLRPAEVQALLGSAPVGLPRNLLTVAVGTGLRMGEILALQWGDIDANQGWVLVRRAFSRGQLLTPKTRTSYRRVRVSGSVLAALAQQKTLSRGTFVFTIHGERCLTSEWVRRRILRPALHAAGLRPVRFHALRHSYASAMVNQGANFKFVSQQLGHSSTQITIDRYSHLIDEWHDHSLEALESMLTPSVAPPAVEEVEHDPLGRHRS